MDFNLARQNMIEQQIRPWDVLDQRTLDLFEHVHREDFVPAEFRQLALADVNVPLSCGEVTMAPKVEARMIQSLALSAHDKVLEVGTGCAFVTALLASAAGEIHSVDIHAEFTRAAGPKLERCGLGNVSLYTGDAARGWHDQAPYDVIAVTGSLPLDAHLRAFEQELRPGGRLFAIVGRSPVMEALLITRVGENEWARESLFETDLPPLRNVMEPPKFRF
jgi:protein-L-isoaspartate(D-aspartate) O-methyltransferase